MDAAKALAEAGYVVEFLLAKDTKGAKSPDISMDGLSWEMKSPKTDKLSAIERNLKRATRQSPNVIIDSRRLQRLHDEAVQNYLVRKLRQQRTIQRLLYINRQHSVIDISELL